MVFIICVSPKRRIDALRKSSIIANRTIVAYLYGDTNCAALLSILTARIRQTKPIYR